MNLDAVRNLKVLLVGDGIIDEYRYVRTLGKAIKEPVISVELLKSENFKGGVWAAAAHAKSFCDHVDVFTGGNVMVSSRYVDETYTRKLFTVHKHENHEQPTISAIGDYDVVIVTDFGHGCLTKDLIQTLQEEANFLAVNAQTNSQNFGFNLVTKYEDPDLVVIDELEARLAAHDRDSPIEEVIRKLGFKRIIVTLGTRGAVGFDGYFHHAPAVTDRVVDTMGAGDAFLAVASLYARVGFPMLDVVRIGNAAGAAKVGIVGHRTAITRKMVEDALSA